MAFKINKIKSLDYNDKYNYSLDNQTIGTAQYYKKKYGDKFDDCDYKILEISSRSGYTDEDLTEAIKSKQLFKLITKYLDCINSLLRALFDH